MKKKLLFLIPAFVGMSVFAQTQQKVGVKTTDPQATLDINGNMAIEKVRDAKSNEKISALFWDSSDRQVKRLNTSDNLFYVLDFRVECTDAGGNYSQKNQWISDFDTKIPVDKYTVLFGRVFPVNRNYEESKKLDILHSAGSDDSGGYTWSKNDNGPKIQIMDYGYAEKTGRTSDSDLKYYGSDGNYEYINPVLRKQLFQKDGTWHFTVGYPDARPDSSWHTGGIVFEWQVQLIAISNVISQVKNVNEASVDMSKEGANTINFKNSPL